MKYFKILIVTIVLFMILSVTGCCCCYNGSSSSDSLYPGSTPSPTVKPVTTQKPTATPKLTATPKPTISPQNEYDILGYWVHETDGTTGIYFEEDGICVGGGDKATVGGTYEKLGTNHYEITWVLASVGGEYVTLDDPSIVDVKIVSDGRLKLTSADGIVNYYGYSGPDMP